MKSKDAKKRLKRIEKAVKGRWLTKHIPDNVVSMIIPDTSALIDLVDLTHSYTEENPESYGCPFLFLESLETKARRILIPESVMGEVKDHGCVKLNYYVREIPPCFLEYLERVADETINFLGNVKYGADSEQVRLDTYWASKIACNGNVKKMEEGFSDVDKDLVAFAGLLGSSEIRGVGKIKIVHVLSSDDHVVSGAKFLRDELGYSNLNPINVRN